MTLRSPANHHCMIRLDTTFHRQEKYMAYTRSRATKLIHTVVEFSTYFTLYRWFINRTAITATRIAQRV
jgi:hypothetical protein